MIIPHFEARFGIPVTRTCIARVIIADMLRNPEQPSRPYRCGPPPEGLIGSERRIMPGTTGTTGTHGKTTVPIRCPYCGSKTVSTDMVEWEARSLEPHNRDNTATLDEHQCRDDACGRSFWT